MKFNFLKKFLLSLAIGTAITLLLLIDNIIIGIKYNEYGVIGVVLFIILLFILIFIFSSITFLVLTIIYLIRKLISKNKS